MFDGPEYRRVLRAARRSLERTGGDLGGAISIANPDDAERKAVIGLTGQYRPAGTARLTVRLADLDSTIREQTGAGLAELLAARGGSLRDRPAETARHAADRESTVRSAEESQLMGEGWYGEWLAGVRRDGTLTRLVNAGEQWRVGQAVRVLEELAARRGVPVLLPELAAAVTGDTKALGPGTVLSTLVLRALAAQAGGARFDTAEERRALWDSSDVVVDDLASRVLVLNLPADGDGLGEWLTGAAARGVPFYVTLQQVAAMPVRVRAGRVRVCENPAVLRRAAGEMGAACGPLLCTEGRPSTAFHQLAGLVTAGGGELAYHGDFDWPGVAIASAVLRRHGGRPWRFGAADYTAAVAGGAAAGGAAAGGAATAGGAVVAGSARVALAGPPQPTPWDPGLAAVMAAAGTAVYEEAVADSLMADLAAG